MEDKVSLILTTYNCLEQFVQTMESIKSQDYDNIEILIKDGLSTDGTVDKIREYADAFKYPVIWDTSHDNGIYDAINHGIQISTGEIIAVFNDRFTRNDAVTMFVRAIKEKKCDGVHADLVYVENDQVKRYWHMGNGKIASGWMPGHPTLFLKREVYDKYGQYDISYSCSADYEFMVRMLKDGKTKLAYIPEVMVKMFYGGTSTSSLQAYWISVSESHKALKTNGYHFCWFIVGMRTLRVMGQFIAKKKIGKASN